MANDNAEHVEADVIADTVKIILERVEKRQEQHPTNKTLPSIFMVPSVIRDANPSCFQPQMVSIGPLHKEDEKLQEYERRKPAYLHDLLSRIDFPLEETLKACVRKVNASIDQIRACYADMSKPYSDAELETMMVMDACCILEYHYKAFGPRVAEEALVVQFLRDLVMLENQIPFFVLRDIFECTYLKFIPSASLTQIVLDLISCTYPFNYSDLQIDDDKNYSHVLDLLHKLFRPKHPLPTTENAAQSLSLFSAVKLSKAGLNFKPNNQDADNFQLAMKFKSSWANPTLAMPILLINGDSEIVFFNLIAYEQCFLNVGSYVSSYVMAMNILVDRKEDLQVLVQSKVIKLFGCDDQYAVDLLQRLCKDIAVQGFTYDEAWVKMDVYCNHGLGWIRQTYFSGKWSYIASISGLIIFIFTAIQTFCAIRSR